MPDQYGFDHLPDWGNLTVACIEVGCSVRGSMFDWPDAKRLEHYLEHHPVKVVYEDSFDYGSLPVMRLGGETADPATGG